MIHFDRNELPFLVRELRIIADQGNMGIEFIKDGRVCDLEMNIPDRVVVKYPSHPFLGLCPYTISESYDDYKNSAVTYSFSPLTKLLVTRLYMELCSIPSDNEIYNRNERHVGFSSWGIQDGYYTPCNITLGIASTSLTMDDILNE